MASAYDLIAAYHSAGRALSCRIPVEPWICEFWPLDAVAQQNVDYQVSTNAPGYVGFASSLGGEMYAISPFGAVVCLAFVGMSPPETLPIADSWESFERMLICAVPSNNRSSGRGVR